MLPRGHESRQRQGTPRLCRAVSQRRAPTLFATNDFRGQPTVLQLTDSNRKPLPKAAFLDHVGQPVRLKGTVVENGDTLIFEIDPSDISELR